MIYRGHCIKMCFGICEPLTYGYRSDSAALILNKKCRSPIRIVRIWIRIAHCGFVSPSYSRSVFLFGACTKRFVGAEVVSRSHCRSYRSLIRWRTALLAAAVRQIIGSPVPLPVVTPIPVLRSAALFASPSAYSYTVILGSTNSVYLSPS